MRSSPRQRRGWLVAGILAATTACSPGATSSEVNLGEKVATGWGNVVIVYGLRPSQPTTEGGKPISGLDLKSCRTRRDGVLLNAGAFSVRTAGGVVLQASGSRLDAMEPDCVTGQILFDVPAGDQAQYALYRVGSKLLRWRIATTPEPPANAR